MNHEARLLVISGLATLITACGESRRYEHGESALGKELEGTWNIDFHLQRSPLLGSDTLSGKRDVNGSLIFLASQSPENHYSGVGDPTDYGTYDIDFSPFGFDPRETGKIPTTVVGWVSPDSIEIVLSPDQTDISVRMTGGVSHDTISGKWEVSFPRAGAGGGSFLMTPRKGRRS